MVTTFRKAYQKLRKNNYKNYVLLVFCDFISVMLVTSYAAILRSPTVLNVLPVGGDSRKQIYMIFALALAGCAAFTLYAASLFFRQKSREMGTFMALGASKPLLKRLLYGELAVVSALSCGAGLLCGLPLAMGIWQLFRIFLVDTKEMVFRIGWTAFAVAGAFACFLILALFLLASVFVRRTNIIDIVNEQRRCEAVRTVPRFCGWLGILLTIAGGCLGYFMPTFFILKLHYYPGPWVNLFYAPLFIGIYMILLHTVVNGWRGGKGYYKNIITHSMMKFQGRQTVNNMLVMTLLLAGAYFASFYTPVTSIGNIVSIASMRYDNLFHYRMDQTPPSKDEIYAMAKEEGIEIQDYREAECVLLGVDGNEHVEEGRSWHYEYQEVLTGRLFFSESAFEQLTGERANLQSGQLYTFMASDGGEPQFGSGYGTTLVTNTISGERLPVEVVGDFRFSEFGSKAFVMSDEDYARMAQGLPDDYRETYVAFNVDDCKNSYPFAKRLFNEFLDRMGPETFHSDSWNQIEKAVREAQGEPYYIEYMEQLDGDGAYRSENRDGSIFRMYAKYMPAFRVLDRADSLKNMAVFITVFLYVSIVCYIAVVLIGYTRCKSIALNNRQVYEDLRRLGANNGYLFRSVRGQVCKVYQIPAIVASAAMFALFTLILFANDGRLSTQELFGLLGCSAVLAALNLILWLCYQATLRSVCETLQIRRP